MYVNEATLRSHVNTEDTSVLIMKTSTVVLKMIVVFCHHHASSLHGRSVAKVTTDGLQNINQRRRLSQFRHRKIHDAFYP